MQSNQEILNADRPEVEGEINGFWHTKHRYRGQENPYAEVYI
ncbi:hypothetical protein SAMN05216327_111191 [Dyadobacter sp. SG02]|nr:hypothetical protein SAMN05216327_111191 [Dyadobacter sp. SG02]